MMSLSWTKSMNGVEEDWEDDGRWMRRVKKGRRKLVAKVVTPPSQILWQEHHASLNAGKEQLLVWE